MTRPRTFLVMLGVGLGMLLAALDQTVVATAMPKVVAHLGGFDLYAWVFTAYMLTMTTTVPIYGKLSDLYGRKIFFLWGMVVFMAGSILCGNAQTMEQLIAFRGLQGIGAGALMPVALAIIGDIFPPGERGKVQGLMGTVFGLSSIVGPSLGGYITDNLDWRWVFYVNIPVGLLALLVVGTTMPWDRPERTHRSIDYLGAGVLVAALVPLLLALSQAGTEYAWTSPHTLGFFAFSAIMLAVFVLVESRATDPLLPLDLFRSGIFTVSIVAVFLTAMGMFGAIMYIPLFVQGVIGASATSSGYVLTPMMLSLIVGSIVGGQLISRWGRYRVIALVGVAVMAVGIFLLSRMTVDTTNGQAVVFMIITGVGLGVTMPLYVIVVQNAFPHSQMGVVTSAVQFFRSIGGTVGVAVMGSLLTEFFRAEMAAKIPAEVGANASPQILDALSNPQLLLSPEAEQGLAAQLPSGSGAVLDQLLQAMRSALASATSRVFFIATFVIIAAWAVNWFLKEIPLRMTNLPAEEADRPVSGGARPRPAEAPGRPAPER